MLRHCTLCSGFLRFILVVMKCARCEQIKSAGEFGLRPSGKAYAWCRQCFREYSRDRYKQQKADGLTSRQRAELAKARRSPLASDEKRRLRQARYYTRHRVEILIRERTRRKGVNRPKSPAARRRYYVKHPEKSRAANKRWRDRHPKAASLLRHRYKHQKRAAPFEAVDRVLVYKRDKGRCHICKKVVSTRSFTLDHIVPLSHGGGYLYTNLRLACRSCNSARGPGRTSAQPYLV